VHIAWDAARSPGGSVAGETRRLARIIRNYEPDVVHLHSAKAGLCGRLVLRGRTPTVFQPHVWSFQAVTGALRAAAIGWERRAARWTQALVCVSEAERRLGESKSVDARYRVIPNGVDLMRFEVPSEERRTAVRERLGLDGPVAVCVGRLSRQKGQDALLDAWSQVRAEVPDASLTLVGSGPDEAGLRARHVDGVSFAGERDDVPEWLSAADVAVFPSRWEAMSLGTLEALAAGCSVVATDVPGAREAIGSDAGAIVPPGDTDALAAAVAARLADPVLAAGEGRAGRERATRSFDLARTCAEVAALYEELL
jgi:glycosyltransferase involved in cell wall biosynthesis